METTASAEHADYANRTGRPSGPFVRLASRVLPGVGFVQRQIGPYAQAWARANRAELSRPGPRWVVLGDSMSQGVGASTFDAGWVDQARSHLAGEYQLINLSASGARVADVLDTQLPAMAALPPKVGTEDRTPDLVTVLIGSNDLLRRNYRDELPGRFDELLAALPTGSIVATLPNPRRAAALVNIAIERAARADHIVMADMRRSNPGSWRGKLAEDHFHPNDLGYTGLAAVFLEAIPADLRRNSD